MLNQGLAGRGVNNHGHRIAGNHTQKNGDDLQHSLAPDIEINHHKNGNKGHDPVVCAVVNGALGQGQTNGNNDRTGNDRWEELHNTFYTERLDQSGQNKI